MRVQLWNEHEVKFIYSRMSLLCLGDMEETYLETYQCHNLSFCGQIVVFIDCSFDQSVKKG